MTVTRLPQGLLVLHDSLPQLTAGLRGSALLTASNSHHHSYVPYPAIVDVGGFSKEINTTLK